MRISVYTFIRIYEVNNKSGEKLLIISKRTGFTLENPI